MPAMWDRLNTASPSPIATAPARAKLPPPPAHQIGHAQVQAALAGPPQKVPPPRLSSRAAPFYHHNSQISHEETRQQQNSDANGDHERFSSSPYPVGGGLQGLGINSLAAHRPTFKVHIPVHPRHLPPSPDELSPDESPTAQETARRVPTRRSSTRNSTWRPTSSIYSHPSPVDTEFTNVAPRHPYGPAAEEISPPSSPETRGARNGRDVSPIDEIPGMSQLDESQAPTARPSSQQRSHIPMMRRQRRQTQEAAATTIRESKSRERLRERQDGGETPEQITSATGRQVFKLAQGKDMRWDAMTGEPTLGPSGRSGQVKPHEYAQGLGNTGPVHPAQSALERLRSAQQSFGDRVRKIRTGGAENDAASKPAAAEETATTVSQVSAQEAPPVSPSAAAASPAAALIGNMTSAPNAGPGPKFSPQRTEPVQKRPEWKGGSGRTALVDPVQDMPSIAPLNIPRKSSKRAARGIRGMSTPLSPISPSGSETSSRDAPTVRKVVPSSQHSSHQQGSNSGVSSPLASPATQPAAAAQAYPSPPKTGSPPPPIPPSHANEPLLMDTQLQSLSHAPNPSSANDAEKAIRRKPPSSNNNLTDTPNTHNTHKVHPSTASSVYSQYDPKSSSIGPNTSALPIAEDGWVQPSSRFSVTTYATSAHDSPRPSVDEVPPLPAPPQVKSQSPVMDRKRPPVMGRGRGPAAEYGSPLGSNPVGSSEPVVISLKSAYMTSPFSGAAPKERTSKMAPSAVDRLPPHMRPAPRTNTMMSTDSDRMSVLSTSKALPPAPPEITTMNANDRVAYLNAKLQGLSNRRLNINRSIKQMTELMPTDNLMASDAVIRKREMEKLKVEGLRTELAEVQREEYELGLKLHRAYKRLDRDAQYEPTTLWVRRVTG